MKTLKFIGYLSIIIVLEIIFWNVSKGLFGVYNFVIACFAVALILKNADTLNEQTLISIEHYLEKPANDDTKQLIEQLFSEIVPSELEFSLFFRYLAAKKTFDEKYK